MFLWVVRCGPGWLLEGFWGWHQPPQLVQTLLELPADDLALSHGGVGSLNLARGCWNFPVCHHRLLSVFLLLLRRGKQVCASSQITWEATGNSGFLLSRSSLGQVFSFASEPGPGLADLVLVWSMEKGWSGSFLL